MLRPFRQSFFCPSPKYPLFVLNTYCCFRLFPVIYLVMLYSSLLLPFSGVFSVAAALFSLPSFRFLFSSSFHFVVVCTVLLAPSLFQSFQSCTLQFQFCLFPLLGFLLPVHGLLSFFDLLKTLFAPSLMLPKSYHIFSEIIYVF